MNYEVASVGDLLDIVTLVTVINAFDVFFLHLNEHFFFLSTY